MDVKIRKIVTHIEETLHDGGPVLSAPARKGYVAMIIENPYAGRYVDDIVPLMDGLKPYGLDMAQRLLSALADGDTARIEAYGKGAIVGEAGELEHGGLWHVPGGYAMRELLGDARAIVPSSKKVGGMNTRIDIPLHHINAAYVRSHFDAIEAGVSDGPKANEICYILAMSTGPRPHARIGGLTVDEISANDGLR
ncbi:MAG: amino acid synthesis family protein [Fimbriimonadaceae bacterium]|nr:amino acid synthesis family protein [Alphaproteobacteria bacterium]